MNADISRVVVRVSIDDSLPEICQVGQENDVLKKDLYVETGLVKLYLPCGDLLPWQHRFVLTDHRSIIVRLASSLRQATDYDNHRLMWDLIREPCLLEISGTELVLKTAEEEPTALLTVMSFIGGQVEFDTTRALYADVRENGPFKAIVAVTSEDHPALISGQECVIDRGRLQPVFKFELTQRRQDLNTTTN